MRVRLFSLMVWLACACTGGQIGAAEPDWNAVEPELLRLLQGLIRIDSQNPPGNEMEVCRFLKRYFDQEGIGCQVYEVSDGRANLLARLRGDGSQKAVLLAAHTDVVPADEGEWSVGPFSGKVRDGFLHGRGALDDKGMLAVEAMALVLLRRLEIPLRRDVLLLATAGEESGGSLGAGWMLERHRDKLDVAFALNEGGRIITRDGQPLYVAIQTEEKTAYNIRLIAQGMTGHSSVPRPDNSIYTLSHALERISRYEPPRHIDAVTRRFFEGIARLDPAVNFVNGEIETSDPLYLALLSNTISPTFVAGGIKSNVHPPYAEVNLNCRLLPNQDVGVFVDGLRQWVGPGPYEFDFSPGYPSPDPSPIDGAGFVLIEQVCHEVWPDIPVLPYLSPGMSDATRFRHEGIATYGLLPFPLEEGEVWRMHGRDERISVEALMTGMKLIYRLAELAGR